MPKRQFWLLVNIDDLQFILAGDVSFAQLRYVRNGFARFAGGPGDKKSKTIAFGDTLAAVMAESHTKPGSGNSDFSATPEPCILSILSLECHAGNIFLPPIAMRPPSLVIR